MTLLDNYENDLFDLQTKYALVIYKNMDKFAKALTSDSTKSITYECGDAVFWFDLILESGYLIQYDFRSFVEYLENGRIELAGEGDEEISFELDSSIITEEELRETLDLLERLLEDYGTSMYEVLKKTEKKTEKAKKNA